MESLSPTFCKIQFWNYALCLSLNPSSLSSLQTFAIPGSIFLSILSGYLFPFYLALTLVCFCSATGATLCYLLSYLVGTKLVNRFAKERAQAWAKKVNTASPHLYAIWLKQFFNYQHQVNEHRNNLLNYIIFLRITPFLPNWFINITSPVIGVPMGPFFFGTFLGNCISFVEETIEHLMNFLFSNQGVAPPSFVAIQAGTTLNQLTSSSDTVSLNSILILAAFAVTSMLPVVFKQRLQKKFSWNIAIAMLLVPY